MANITESEALGVVSLEAMKEELRIPPVDPLKATDITET